MWTVWICYGTRIFLALHSAALSKMGRISLKLYRYYKIMKRQNKIVHSKIIILICVIFKTYGAGVPFGTEP